MSRTKVVLSAVIVAVLISSSLVMVFSSQESSGYLMQETNRYGSYSLVNGGAGAGMPITAWVDGVDYSVSTSTTYGGSKYDVYCFGDESASGSRQIDYKLGGSPGETIIYSIDHATGVFYADEVDTFEEGAIISDSLRFNDASSGQPVQLKLQEIVISPSDSESQYVYIYNPSLSSVSLSDYYLEKNDGSINGQSVMMSGSVSALSALYFEIGSTSYLNVIKDELKLVWSNTGSSAANGQDIVVDRAEWGNQLSIPDDTRLVDAVTPSTNGALRRDADGNPSTQEYGTDTDDCSVDFYDMPETGRGAAPAEILQARALTVSSTGNSVSLEWQGTAGGPYNVYRSSTVTGFDFQNPHASNVAGLTWTDPSVSGSDVWYYLVRPSSGAAATLDSTMAVWTRLSHTYNPSNTNLYWISVPYECEYLAGLNAPFDTLTASDIVMAIEGGLGEGTNTKITTVMYWDASIQNTRAFSYRPFPVVGAGWNIGTDFEITPGLGLVISLSTTAGSFSWDIVGTDLYHALDFTYSAVTTNLYWQGMPYTADPTLSGTNALTASDIVMAIEGGLGEGTNTKITTVMYWDASIQNTQAFSYRPFPVVGAGWNIGTDFEITPGLAIVVSLSTTAGTFQWTPDLMVPPNQ